MIPVRLSIAEEKHLQNSKKQRRSITENHFNIINFSYFIPIEHKFNMYRQSLQ